MNIEEILNNSPAIVLIYQDAAKDKVERIINETLGLCKEGEDEDPYNFIYCKGADYYDWSLEFDFYQDKNSKETTYETFSKPTDEQIQTICKLTGCGQFWINFYDHERGKKLAEYFCRGCCGANLKIF